MKKIIFLLMTVASFNLLAQPTNPPTLNANARLSVSVATNGTLVSPMNFFSTNAALLNASVNQTTNTAAIAALNLATNDLRLRVNTNVANLTTVSNSVNALNVATNDLRLRVNTNAANLTAVSNSVNALNLATNDLRLRITTNAANIGAVSNIAVQAVEKSNGLGTNLVSVNTFTIQKIDDPIAGVFFTNDASGLKIFSSDDRNPESLWGGFNGLGVFGNGTQLTGLMKSANGSATNSSLHYPTQELLLDGHGVFWDTGGFQAMSIDDRILAGAWTADGDLTVSGKVSATGGFDPPYVLYDARTRAETKARVLVEVPLEKQTGAALFWNTETKRLEVFVASDDKFFDLNGNALEAPIANDVTLATTTLKKQIADRARKNPKTK